MYVMRLVAPLLLVVFAVAAQDNSLTPDEKRSGWKLLFDGKTMNGWLDPAGKNQPGDAWLIEDGTLTTRVKPRIEEDLITAASYGDFELKFDWKVSESGNTGVKYRLQDQVFVDKAKVQLGPGGFEGLLGREMANPKSDRKALSEQGGFLYTIAFEFQLLDDERHPDARRDAAHRTGALYAMIPANTTTAKPAGEWNTGRLVVKGDQFEHWINGTKVLSGSLKDPRESAGVEKRWGKWAPKLAAMLSDPKRSGPIALQHHGDRVWFRNLKVRELK